MNGSAGQTASALEGRIVDGRFELIGEIGDGSGGRVYRATQRPTNRVVAVKVLDIDGSVSPAELLERFFLQACLSARVTHPNVVRIFDYGCDDDLFYLATEYLDSGNVAELVGRAGPLSLVRALGIIRQASAGLAETHEHGLVHGDLRPPNLVLTQRNGQDWVKVHVLGLLSEGEVDSVQAVQPPPGDPFRAPERVAGQRPDARTDVYALGAILFFMLTGRHPPGPDERSATGQRNLSLAAFDPSVANPSGLERLLETCLALDPADRYASMPEFGAAIEAIMFSVTSSMPTEDGPEEAFESQDASAILVAALAPKQDVVCGGRSQAGFAETAEVEVHGAVRLIEQALADARWGEDLPEEAEPVADPVDVERLSRVDLDEYVAYIDLNCPFCYAHHERFVRWGQADRLRWRLVEHASHIIDGPFDAAQETILAREVLSLHRRAPDVNVVLPPRRFSSTLATRLLVYVERTHPHARAALLTALYRALWREGRDIGDRTVLSELLAAQDLPTSLLDLCDETPPEMLAWQRAWETADYDTCIPVTTHVPSERVLIGLPAENVLMEFLLGARSRLLDNAVCFYRPRPSLLLCGRLGPLWPLLDEIRLWSDLVVRDEAAEAAALLDASARPDMVIVHADELSPGAQETLIAACSRAEVPWLWATVTPNAADEAAALATGASEYLPVVDDAEIARGRLRRLIIDRLIRRPTELDAQIDAMTGLANRRGFIEHLAAQWDRSRISRRPLSLLFVNLDHFRAFNSVQGALAADRRLKGIASAIAEAVAPVDGFAARIGGDVFAVLLPNESAESAQDFAERLRVVIRSEHFEGRTDSTAQRLTASIGVATRRVLAGVAPDLLVEAAEDACWTAKDNGRDQVAFL